MAHNYYKPNTCGSNAAERVSHLWRNRLLGGVQFGPKNVGSLTEKQQAWLEEQGLTIKVMQRNQESLFRAVAEELCMTQANAEKVKQMVVKYMSDQGATMEQRIRLAYGKEMAMKPCAQLERAVYELGKAFGKEPVTPWHAYIYRLANGSNVAGAVEIGAISALFKVKILVYRAIPSAPLTFGKFVATDGMKNEKKMKTIKLLNFYGSNHYDLLVPTESVKAAAVCQSIVYEVLYEKVFGLENTIAASSAALGSQEIKGDTAQDEEEDQLKLESISESCSSASSRESARRLNRKDPDGLNHIKQTWLPFPLKVAKSLDPSTFRDNDLDPK